MPKSDIKQQIAEAKAEHAKVQAQHKPLTEKLAEPNADKGVKRVRTFLAALQIDPAERKRMIEETYAMMCELNRIMDERHNSCIRMVKDINEGFKAQTGRDLFDLSKFKEIPENEDSESGEEEEEEEEEMHVIKDEDVVQRIKIEED